MTLDQYLNGEGALSRAELSKKLEITRGRLSQLKNADWPPELALKAEEETGGALDASVLSSIIARARKDAA